MILDWTGTLEVKNLIKTPDIILNNVGLQGKLDGISTSLTNISGNVSSALAELSSVENTFGNDILEIKTTLPSFLQTTNFNSTITS